jgi:predicted 2-oxoglutarate/Fe(II)-dependent dioxygenase YbiX
MAGLSLLRALNFLVIEQFFDHVTCARMRSAMCDAASAPAMIGDEGTLDERQRRTRVVEVPAEMRRLAVERFEGVRERAALHFGVELTEMESPQFLRYRPGDFFIRHMDQARDGSNRRQVSFIVFLNADFEGGALKFGGLAGTIVLTVPATEGLLVLFRSDWVHEVEPVTRGERFTLVGWFG